MKPFQRLVATLVLVAVRFAPALAQEAAPPPRPAPDSMPAPLLSGPPPIGAAAPLTYPEPEIYPAPHASTGPQPPGWYTAVEIAAIGPNLKQRLAAPIIVGSPVATFMDSVQLPGANVDWTASGTISLGYRFWESQDAFQVSFRSFATDGEAELLNFDPVSLASLVTRLDLNVLDLDYLTAQTEVGRGWDVRWLVGARLADVFFDNEAQGFVLRQRSRSHFLGVGPHAGLDLWRTLPFTSLALYGRVEGSLLLGRVRQRFEEDVNLMGVALASGETRMSGSQTVPTLSAQLGLSWTPVESWRWFRITGGYQFEQWWHVGRLGDSRADLDAHGLFLRLEWQF